MTDLAAGEVPVDAVEAQGDDADRDDHDGVTPAGEEHGQEERHDREPDEGDHVRAAEAGEGVVAGERHGRADEGEDQCGCRGEHGGDGEAERQSTREGDADADEGEGGESGDGGPVFGRDRLTGRGVRCSRGRALPGDGHEWDAISGARVRGPIASGSAGLGPSSCPSDVDVIPGRGSLRPAEANAAGRRVLPASSRRDLSRTGP